MKSFKRYQYRVVLTDENLPAHGDFIFEDATFRFKGGYLNDAKDEEGNTLPAVEATDGSHYEHWKNGVLHCEGKPSVKDVKENIELWYQNGKEVVPGENNGRIKELK